MEKDCAWKTRGEDNGENTYHTGCQKFFEFSDGGVADNGFEFCPFCGGAITIQNEADS